MEFHPSALLRKDTDIDPVQTAVTAARRAGGLLMERFGGSLTVDRSDSFDVKLEVDVLAEEIVLGMIRSSHPEDWILSEEAGAGKRGTSERIWIVDPLDGTVNYYHGLPSFGVSVACYERRPDGTPGIGLLGVVYVPTLDEMFVGVCGEGSQLNGRELAPPAAVLSQSAVTMTLSAREGRRDPTPQLLARLSRAARKVRSFGATAVEIVNVAAGRLAAHVQFATNLWDFAGAAVVLESAGGVLRKREIEEGKWEIVAANRGVLTEVASIMDELSGR
jgi:fructose-1,6-bisphosphatase/inositol monophosphatase family enzyme